MVTIVLREGYGRVMVATEPILDVGTVIIREKPLMQWKTYQWETFFDAFLASSIETKKRILDLYVPEHHRLLMDTAKYVASMNLRDPASLRGLGHEILMNLNAIAVAYGNIASFKDAKNGFLNPEDSTSYFLALGSHVVHRVYRMSIARR
jgi:hypothetical protein